MTDKIMYMQKTETSIKRLSDLVWANSSQGVNVSWRKHSTDERMVLTWALEALGQEALTLSYYLTPDLLKKNLENLALAIASANEIAEQMTAYMFTHKDIATKFSGVDVTACCYINKDAISVAFSINSNSVPIDIPYAVIDTVKNLNGNERMIAVINEAWNIISEKYRQITGHLPSQDDDSFFGNRG